MCEWRTNKVTISSNSYHSSTGVTDETLLSLEGNSSGSLAVARVVQNDIHTTLRRLPNEQVQVSIIDTSDGHFKSPK